MSPISNDDLNQLRQELLELLAEDRLRQERQITAAKKDADWHAVRLMGARLAILFIFVVPILALSYEFACHILLKSHENISSHFDNLIWTCAAGMATIIAVLFKGGKKNGKDLLSRACDVINGTSASESDRQD